MDIFLIMIVNDHDFCAHNPAHKLAHNPFDNHVVTSMAPSKGELTSSFSFSTARTSCCLDQSTLVVSDDPFTYYIKPPLYSGTPLKTALGHIFGTYLFLCLIGAHGKRPWFGYHQESLASGHSDGSSRAIKTYCWFSFLESNLVTITPPNITSPTYLVKILHQDERNGEHPHEDHFSKSQFVNHLFKITCETLIHGPSLMEVDGGSKFLENEQVDWGVHQHDALYDYPHCNHLISNFSSILVAIPSLNPSNSCSQHFLSC